jgi:hypothetical protein
MKFLIFSLIVIGIISGISLGVSTSVSAEENSIPSWIKKSAEWWVNDGISDTDFIKSIEYLVNNDIIQITSSDSSINEEFYVTYVSKHDNFRIKIPSLWLIMDSDSDDISMTATNMDYQRDANPEHILVGIASTNYSELDDFMDDIFLPHLDRTATDLEILDSEWTNKYRDVPYGANITFEHRQGKDTLITTFSFSLVQNTIYYVQHETTTSQKPSIDLDYIVDSLEIGLEAGYDGIVFD